MIRNTLLLATLTLASTACVTVECDCACGGADVEQTPALALQEALPEAAGAAELERPPCAPPPLQALGEIPFDDRLMQLGRGVRAAFEVEGDRLVAADYDDPELARGALGLWQELVLRIPTNQRPDLVQFEITSGGDPAGATDNSGTGGTAGRFGAVLSFSEDNLGLNPADPCAQLQPRRGTFDWTLIHEFAHLRTYEDGTLNAFIKAFGKATGPGDGYPEDGSPKTSGDWVSSYAERAGDDEDCAESFTAFVMLAELPREDSLAARKVRWFAGRPGYPELRRRLRITEPEGSAAPLAPAPLRSYPLEIEPPDWLLGTWAGELPGGGTIAYAISAADIVRTVATGPGDSERWSYRDLREVDPLATVDLYESGDSFYLHQISLRGRSFSESFSIDDAGLRVDNELLGEFGLRRVP